MNTIVIYGVCVGGLLRELGRTSEACAVLTQAVDLITPDTLGDLPAVRYLSFFGLVCPDVSLMFL